MSEKKSKAPRAAGNRGPATIDLRQSFVVVRAHLPTAAAIALVLCTFVAWQQLRQPKMYFASAALVVERPERIESDRMEYGATEMMTLTRLEQLRSPELAERVANSLTPEERTLVLAPYGPAPAGPGEQRLRSVVRGAMTPLRREGTMLIAINVVHRSPAATALLANRYAEQAVRYAFDRSSTSTNASLAFLREQAEDLRSKSEAAERALQEYRQRYNLVSLEANQNIIVDNLKALNASATAARVVRLGIEARLAQAEIVTKRGDDPDQLAAIAGSEDLGEIARRLADLRGKRTVMAERYGRRHPAMQQNQREIEALEKQRSEVIQTALASLRDQRDKALAEERQLDAQRAKAEKDSLNLDQLAVEYNILRRTVETHKASYSQILARLNDATISSQLRGVNLKISELATPPGGPISPNPRKTALIVGALALGILLGYPFSVELFFGRIRSSADVEYYLNTDLLGEIGSVRTVQEKDRPHLVNSQHDEAAAEQFRALYSQLSLSSKIDPPKAILITSTLPSEGKSFIAANLAESFVAHGRRTLLVDADLRRPTQHRNFNLPNDRGLVRWIGEGASLSGDLLKNEALGMVEVVPGLFLLRAGGVSRKATELMSGGQLGELFATLQRSFDIVILDTPPAGVFPDAIAFARVCHELIYICRFNTASRNAVRDVWQRMRQTGLETPGIVLNAMPTGFAGGYYYKGYSYQDAKRYSKRYAEPKD